MPNIYSFQDYIPVIHQSAFVHDNATVTGNVVIGKDVYIGPGAAIRGDWGEIIIEDGCNVQENCVIHMFPGVTVVLKTGAHIGHGAIIHGATIGVNALIGMNSVVMDNVTIGSGSIVGALSLVPSEMNVPDRTLVAGVPAKVIKPVTDEMLAWKTRGTELYQQLPSECHSTLRAVAPLREIPAVRPKRQQAVYATWFQTESKGEKK